MEKELPDSWVKIELGNILKLKNGYAFKGNDFKDTGVPVIRISNIQNELVQTENAARVDLSKIKQEFIVQQGDILIAMSGATTGKYGIYNEKVVALQNQRVGNLIPHDESLTSRKFILYLLGGLKKEIEEKAYGGAQPNISPKLIEEIRIGLPPLPEQQRIVAKLDTLFGQLDRIKIGMERIPQLIKDFRQKVLTQAVTGNIEEYIEFGDYEIDIQTGPFGSALHKEEYIENGIPVINPSHIIDGEITPNQQVTITQSKLKELSRWILEDGDVILGRRGEMGRAAVYFEKNKKMICGTGSLVLKKSTRMDSMFLMYYLRSQYTISYLTANSVGSTMVNLNQKIIKSLPFPDLNIDEQKQRIVMIESLFAKADQIEASYQKIKAKIEQLPQALLAKAFRGELVEQLPTDGDARYLLEQIKRANAGLEKGGKGKRLGKVVPVRMVAEDGVRYGKK